MLVRGISSDTGTGAGRAGAGRGRGAGAGFGAVSARGRGFLTRFGGGPMRRGWIGDVASRPLYERPARWAIPITEDFVTVIPNSSATADAIAHAGI